jgi:hypothetical protein
VPSGIGYWDHAVFEIQAAPAPGIDATLGTARFAVTVALRDAAGAPVVLGSDGAQLREGWDDPRSAPGFRVTRHGGDSLVERSLGFAGVPFRADANRFEAIARVGMGSAELFAAAYEDLSGSSFGVDPLPALDGPEWAWLFEVVATARRRAATPGPFVAQDGRPIPWRGVNESTGVAAGDVAVVGGWVAFLEADDGDGRLANTDQVLHGSSGVLKRGTLAELPEGGVTVLRVRDLSETVRALSNAGYGPLPPGPLWTARARRSMTEFQRDRGLALSGVPDAAASAAREQFLNRLDEPSAPDSSRGGA